MLAYFLLADFILTSLLFVTALQLHALKTLNLAGNSFGVEGEGITTKRDCVCERETDRQTSRQTDRHTDR